MRNDAVTPLRDLEDGFADLALMASIMHQIATDALGSDHALAGIQTGEGPDKILFATNDIMQRVRRLRQAYLCALEGGLNHA